MFGLRRAALIVAVIAVLLVLQSSRASAGWWRSAPADFEACAELAAKAATQQDKTAALADCNSKFAGRRKPGGGYTYYDFMQDRSFDIAGPNPTPEEQKYIDEQYALYLEKQRRNSIAAALSANQQLREPQQASLHTETEKVPIPQARPSRLIEQANQSPPCPTHLFSCEWPKLSETLHDLRKKLFGVAPGKGKKSDGTSIRDLHRPELAVGGSGVSD